MKSFQKLILRAILLFSMAGSAWSYGTGNELFAAMHVKDQNLEVLMFVKGVTDSAVWAYELGKTGTVAQLTTEEINKALGICMSNGVTRGQAVDVIKKWLQNSPEKRHLNASFLVLFSLRQGFPCRQ